MNLTLFSPESVTDLFAINAKATPNISSKDSRFDHGDKEQELSDLAQVQLSSPQDSRRSFLESSACWTTCSACRTDLFGLPIRVFGLPTGGR